MITVTFVCNECDSKDGTMKQDARDNWFYIECSKCGTHEEMTASDFVSESDIRV